MEEVELGRCPQCNDDLAAMGDEVRCTCCGYLVQQGEALIEGWGRLEEALALPLPTPQPAPQPEKKVLRMDGAPVDGPVLPQPHGRKR